MKDQDSIGNDYFFLETEVEGKNEQKEGGMLHNYEKRGKTEGM